MLVLQTNPPGIELCYHANVFFCFGGKTWLLITRVQTLHHVSFAMADHVIKTFLLAGDKR